MNRTLSLSFGAVTCALLSSGATAQILATVNVPGTVNFGGTIGSADGIANNSVIPGLGAVGTAGYMGNGVIINSANLTSVIPGTWTQEEQIRIENSAFPGQSYRFQVGTLGATFTAVSIPAGTFRPWLVDALIGGIMPSGSTWTIEAFDSANDGAGPDATGTNINFGIKSGTPPPSGAISTINVPGPVDFAAAPGNPLNTVLTGLSPVATAQWLGNGVKINSANIAFVAGNTWEREAQVRVNNSAFPTSFYTFQFSTVAATYTSFSVPAGTNRAWLTTGGIGSIIPATSTWNLEFFESADDIEGVEASGTNINFDILVGAAPVPGATPALAIDLGTVTPTNPLSASTQWIGATRAKWYKFTLGSNVDAVDSEWLSVFTSATEEDTELGLYASDGTFLATDDDDAGFPRLSHILFGLTPGDSSAGFDGAAADGLSLAAGLYYIAVGRFNSAFTANFGFSSTAPAVGDWRLNVTTGAQQQLSGNLILDDTTFDAFGINRTIAYTVMQGTTTVGSGSILASSASTAFNITSSHSGSAVISFDGSSFLKQKVNLVGGSQNLGDVHLQNGDVDNSGEVDAVDIDEVIADFGFLGDDASDVNVSGEVDAIDIDIVIANFGGIDD